MSEENTTGAPAEPEVVEVESFAGAEAFEDEFENTPEEMAAYEAEMEVEPVEVEAAAPVTAADEAEVSEANPESGDALEASAVEEEPPEEVVVDTPQVQIPKARLDRELQRNRDLQQQLNEAVAHNKVSEVAAVDDTPFDVPIDLEQITRALDMNLDGKNSEAAGILIKEITSAVQAGMQQGRNEMRGEMTARSEAAVATAVGQVGQQTAQQAYDSAVTSVEDAYPIFNPDSDGYDAELAGRVGTIMNALRADGLDAAEALTEAVDLTLTRHRPELITATPAAAVVPVDVNKATESSRARNAAAAGSQPARQSGTANSAEVTGINLDQLTDAEFDALPASRLAELRGDFL
jgi:hypothetical protein